MSSNNTADAANSILSLFRDDEKRVQTLGQFGRGRVISPLIAVSEGAKVSLGSILRTKAIMGVFVGDRSIQFYNGERIAYEFEWADVNQIFWKDIKFEEPVFQKWMLWEIQGEEASGRKVSICFASHALALFGEPSIADLFYKAIKPTGDEAGFENIKKYKDEANAILNFVENISISDLP
jgi:hypothetical protein